MPSIRYCDWAAGQDAVIKTDRTTAIIAWSSLTTYAINDLVNDNGAYPNKKCYKSLQNINLNHALSDASWWVLVSDGTYTYPYQSITEASQGLTGGDEVRCAKGAARTAISQNLTWTDNSTSVVCTGHDVSAEIAATNFICKHTAGFPGSEETVYEVASVVYSGGNTTITLVYKYVGSTDTVVSDKISTISTGTGTTTTPVQVVSNGGSSLASMLKISGGWTLATQTQDDETWYFQSNATKGGYGLGNTAKSFVEVANLGWLRYREGYHSTGVGGNIHNCTGAACLASTGVGTSLTGTNNTVTSCVGVGNGSSGIQQTGANNLIDTCFGHSNTGQGINNAGPNCTIRSFKGHSNGGQGIYMGSPNCNAYSPICSNNTTAAVFLGAVSGGKVINLTGSGNGAMYSVPGSVAYGEFPEAVFATYGGTPGDHRQVCEFGVFQTDAAVGNTAVPSLLCTPGSATYYCRPNDLIVGPVIAATGYIVGCYMKKSAGWNGDCILEVYNSNRTLVGTLAIPNATMTTSFVNYTISVSSGDVPESNVCMFLRIRIRGTSGTVWIDDVNIA